MTNQPVDQTGPVVSGHQDPEGEAPWALQLVVHLEKVDPPTDHDTCVAAATAVVALLDHEQSRPEGDWHPAVERWLAGRIRKVTRRARGAAWVRVQDLPGVTVTVGSAQVRAIVPAPTDRLPSQLSKLQVAGLDLEDETLPAEADAAPGTLLIAVNPTVPLSTGKRAAQVAHASNVAWLHLDEAARAAWAARGWPIQLHRPDLRTWDAFRDRSPVQIHDAGFTEIPAGTLTCTASWA